MTQPNLPPGMTMIPEAELADLRAQLEDLESRAIPQSQLDFYRATVDRIPELEAAMAERNNLRTQLSDQSQEKDRLRGLLLQIVPSLEAFNVDYPQATIARTAFAGDTPEEIAEKMAMWDAARQQKTSEWNSLVNNVRTQATV